MIKPEIGFPNDAGDGKSEEEHGCHSRALARIVPVGQIEYDAGCKTRLRYSK
jgi:hypothetical protein